jgi:cytochrome c biogenesis protein CcmG/thiol:disulfide interchange protein DsbE
MSEEFTPPSAMEAEATSPRHMALFLAPAIALALILAMFGWGLLRGTDDLPSTMIGKPAPEFALPSVQGRTVGLSSADLRGEVSLVNVFSSWCVPCRIEHPLFLELGRTGEVPIHGINYKDQPDEAAAWLDERGDPYTRTGADLNGRVAIDWGVYGIPETFVVGVDGRIAYNQIGPILRRVVGENILPLVRKLQAEAGKVGTQ